ncbi:MAG TPA: hypothetical protein VI895_07865 [Bdellovibrionota bacterium]|nr:hypothetical protein [Bdellovibrionota bacterium]
MILTAESRLPYHGRVARSFLAAILVWLGFSGVVGWAQCRTVLQPVRTVATTVEADTQPVFQKLGLRPERAKNHPAADSIVGGDDHLIVPGKRVGAFEIGTGVESVRSRLRLSTPTRAIDPAYEFLLPLGYRPERDFRENRERGLRFAFTVQDRKLNEIFVRNRVDHTEDQLRVGTSENVLVGKGTWTVRKSAKGRQFYLGEGITFVVEKDEITEIVVLKKSLSR